MQGGPERMADHVNLAQQEHTSFYPDHSRAMLVRYKRILPFSMPRPISVSHVPSILLLHLRVMRGRIAFVTLDLRDQTEGHALCVLLELTKQLQAVQTAYRVHLRRFRR